MADVEAGNDAAAIERAKAILVQTATFDSAANEYDARSNGNFDEVAIASANDENGGLYIFEYRDGRKQPTGFSQHNAQSASGTRGGDPLRGRSSR